jgi:hypothetical protein
MPYETVKIVQKFQSYYPSYAIELEDDDIWKRFCFYSLDTNDIWILTTVANVLGKDGTIKKVVYKDYKFPLRIQMRGYDKEVRTLYLTSDFLTSYPVSEGTPIHVFLNTVVREKETIKTSIFDEIERGIMDVEPKNESGELLTFNDSLITVKTNDDYYSSLFLEINHAFIYKVPNATLVMLRKLFENLIVDLLTAMFGLEDVGLYYSVENHRHLSLNQLMPNLRKKFKELTILDEGLYREEDDFFRLLDEIKQYGDASAHVLSLEKNMDRISRLKPRINKHSRQIIQLTNKIRLAKRQVS